ncbi:hypothetical protein LEMLEM_LOCUS7703 [Lemmus lemmus]
MFIVVCESLQSTGNESYSWQTSFDGADSDNLQRKQHELGSPKTRWRFPGWDGDSDKLKWRLTIRSVKFVRSGTDSPQGTNMTAMGGRIGQAQTWKRRSVCSGAQAAEHVTAGVLRVLRAAGALPERSAERGLQRAAGCPSRAAGGGPTHEDEGIARGGGKSLRRRRGGRCRSGSSGGSPGVCQSAPFENSSLCRPGSRVPALPGLTRSRRRAALCSARH